MCAGSIIIFRIKTSIDYINGIMFSPIINIDSCLCIEVLIMLVLAVVAAAFAGLFASFPFLSCPWEACSCRFCLRSSTTSIVRHLMSSKMVSSKSAVASGNAWPAASVAALPLPCQEKRGGAQGYSFKKDR